MIAGYSNFFQHSIYGGSGFRSNEQIRTLCGEGKNFETLLVEDNNSRSSTLYLLARYFHRFISKKLNPQQNFADYMSDFRRIIRDHCKHGDAHVFIELKKAFKRRPVEVVDQISQVEKIFQTLRWMDIDVAKIKSVIDVGCESTKFLDAVREVIDNETQNQSLSTTSSAELDFGAHSHNDVVVKGINIGTGFSHYEKFDMSEDLKTYTGFDLDEAVFQHWGLREFDLVVVNSVIHHVKKGPNDWRTDLPDFLARLAAVTGKYLYIKECAYKSDFDKAATILQHQFFEGVFAESDESTHDQPMSFTNTEFDYYADVEKYLIDAGLERIADIEIKKGICTPHILIYKRI